jgi:hypothetical protein
VAGPRNFLILIINIFLNINLIIALSYLSSPLFLLTGISSKNKKKFEQLWLTDAQHSEIVQNIWHKSSDHTTDKLQETLQALHTWGNQTFGHIPTKVKEIQSALQTLNTHANVPGNMDIIKNKEKELDDLLAKEELWWNQRSRALWLNQGDKNTSLFHQKANQRRRKNRIEAISNQTGNTFTDRDKIEDCFLDYFKGIFTSQTISNLDTTTAVVCNKLTQTMIDTLETPFSDEEIFAAIAGMKGLAAPGPDGLPALFYHSHWNIVGPEITKMSLNILNNQGDPSPFNKTNICLIPKIKKPSAP